jgi:multiple antibiotic resistance protein
MKCKSFLLLVYTVLSIIQSNFIVSHILTRADATTICNNNANYNNNICSNIKFINNKNVFSNTGYDVFTNPFQPLSLFLNKYGIDILKAVITLFVVIDPIGIVPLFASLTQKMQRNEQKAVSQTATITAGVLLFVFAIAGNQIFSIFGIDIFSFMIAGGVLLFIVSIELLTHGAWRFGGDTHSDQSGVVPLAFPLLAGPGAITTVIISYQSTGLIVTILSIAIVIATTYMILSLANPIYRILGRRGSMVITRVFAVLVAAFAVQYIVEGTKQIYLTII